jgi:putative ABC transport system permease protein
VLEQDNDFSTNTFIVNERGIFAIGDIDAFRTLIFITLEDYNRETGAFFDLAGNEVLLYSNRSAFTKDSFSLFDEQFMIKERIKSIPGGDIMASDLAGSYYIIVKNQDIIDKMYEEQLTGSALTRYRYAYDLDAAPETVIEASAIIRERLSEASLDISVECREADRGEYVALYGGVFFIGIFLGILFIMATVLIIYYKQINEGYGDRERFLIMKNIGLDSMAIKKTIRSQILTVFFLPLVMAGIHIIAAFPALTKIMALLLLWNVPLFGLSTVICFLVFAVFYAVVYSLTARAYYKIVG